MDPYARHKEASFTHHQETRRDSSTKRLVAMPQVNQEILNENSNPYSMRRASTDGNKNSNKNERLAFTEHNGIDSIRSAGSMDRTPLAGISSYSIRAFNPPRVMIPFRNPNQPLGVPREQPSTQSHPFYSSSFSQSEASSDNSSFPDSFSLAGDNLLPDLPPVKDLNVEIFDSLNSYPPSSAIIDTQSTSTRPPRNRADTSRVHPSYGTTEQLFQRLAPPHLHPQPPSVPVVQDEEDSEAALPEIGSFRRLLISILDPSEFLSTGIKFREDGTPYFDDDTNWSVPGILRLYLYNPVYPEFTSVQQFTWAVIIGITMGVFTAAWKILIERCVLFVWKDIPTLLLQKGYFSSLEGGFPIYHYMWICPSIMGAVLSYISASLPTPIPGQNDWIHGLHSRGIQEYDTFWQLFILSTAGMASGRVVHCFERFIG